MSNIFFHEEDLEGKKDINSGDASLIFKLHLAIKLITMFLGTLVLDLPYTKKQKELRKTKCNLLGQQSKSLTSSRMASY